MSNNYQQETRTARSWILCGLVATLSCPVVALALSCGSIPNTYPITAGASGSLTIGSGSTVNGTAISGSGNSVQMSAVRTSATPTFVALTPATYPSFSSNTNTSAATVAAGTYSSVQPGSGTTTFSGGTYYIASLSPSNAATSLVFNSGIYYITNVNLPANGLTITVSGSVTLNIGSNFSVGAGAVINNGGPVSTLRVYLYPSANASLGSSVQFTGVIYGPGTNIVNVGTGVQVTGLIEVTGSVTLSGNDSVTLSSANQTAIGNISTCSFASPDHYQVQAVGSAVNCYPEPLFIFPHNSSHSSITTTDTILLSTSTGHGDWFLGGGQGSFFGGSSNSGTATYQFSSSDGGVVLFFLRDTYPETVTVNVTDGAITAKSGTAQASEDPPIVFAPSGFRITNGSNSPAIIGTQVAGVTSTQSLALQAIRTDTATGACTALFASGAQVNVNMGFQCNNPTSCAAGQTLTINSNGTSTSIASNPNSAITNYTSVPLTFSTSNAEAPFSLSYTDAGQITLASQYNILLSNNSGSGNLMTGTSQFVVQPYTLKLSSIKATATGTANPSAGSASGTAFLAAGQAFSATVTATNAQGAATPNFGRETSPATVTLTPALVLPASGHNPAVSGNFGSFSSGAATGTGFSWPEVGIMTLTPGVTNYLATGAITGTTSSNIGRFVPNSFTTAVNTPVFGTACSAGSFTYMGQPFGYTVAPVITVTALSLSGTTTTNYTGAFMRISNGSLTGRTYTPTPSTPGLVLTGLPATTGDPAIADLGAGQASLAGQVTLTYSAGSGISFARGTPIAPFTANIALSQNIIDLDGVTATNPVSIGASGGISFSTGASQEYGRLSLRNSLGSELLDLPMSLTTQYYLNSTQGFVTNTADVCTTAPTIAFSYYQLNLSAGETCVRDSGNPGLSGAGCAAAAPNSTAYKSAASSGNFNLTLAAPGSGNSGAATVTATAPSWLQYLWNASSGINSSPSGMATFGIFPGPPSRVHQREVY